MTATNHALTGAVIASVVQQPVVAVILALISHFICDALPHFGMYEEDHIKRNASRLFRCVRAVDLTLLIGLLIAVPLFAASRVTWDTMLLCMVAAVIPDAVWIPQFMREVKTRHEEPLIGFNKFHQAIQWFEKPSGLGVEMIWLTACSYVLLKLF